MTTCVMCKKDEIEIRNFFHFYLSFLLPFLPSILRVTKQWIINVIYIHTLYLSMYLKNEQGTKVREIYKDQIFHFSFFLPKISSFSLDIKVNKNKIHILNA